MATKGTEQPRIPAALVGCGYWGSNLCRALAQHPRFDLTWVCDGSAEARQKATRLVPNAKPVATIDPVLADPGVAAVIVATPVASHAELAMRAIAAGKHVLVEKPLAGTASAAEILCEEAARTRAVLMVGHTFLYNGAVRRIKSMLDDGVLGDIRYFFCRRLNLGIVRQDVDALWNLAPHDLSMLEYWHPQRITDCAAVGHSYLQPGIADVVFLHLSYEDGTAGHVQVSWLDPRKVRDTVIVGSEKMLLFDDVSPDTRITVFDKGVDVLNLDTRLGEFDSYAAHQLIVRAGDIWMPRVDYPEPLTVELEEFAAAITESRPPLTDGWHGLKIVRLLERATEAMNHPI
jgi:predicted dehydrogenase